MPYRQISHEFWTDETVRSLTYIGKGIWACMLTQINTMPIGVMNLSINSFCEEINTLSDRVSHMVSDTLFDTLNPLFEKGSIRYSEEGRFFFFRNFLKHNPINSPKLVIAWKKYLAKVPECALKNEVIQTLDEYVSQSSESIKEAWKSLGIKVSDTVCDRVSDTLETRNKKLETRYLKKTVTKKSSENRERRELAKSILEFLNLKTGRNFKPLDSNLKFIEARLREGFTRADCHAIIANKYEDWHKDPKMFEYLRPATLFNATKFAQYAGELPAEKSE